MKATLFKIFAVLATAMIMSACKMPFSDSGSTENTNDENTPAIIPTVSGGGTVPIDTDVPVDGTPSINLNGRTLFPVESDLVDLRLPLTTKPIYSIPISGASPVISNFNSSNVLGPWLRYETGEASAFVQNCNESCSVFVEGVDWVKGSLKEKNGSTILSIIGEPEEVGDFSFTVKVCKPGTTSCAEKNLKVTVKENIAIELYRVDVDQNIWVKIDTTDPVVQETGISIKYGDWLMARAISAKAPKPEATKEEETTTDSPEKPNEELASGDTYKWKINDTELKFGEKHHEGLAIFNDMIGVGRLDPFNIDDTGEWNKNFSTVFIRLLVPNEQVALDKLVISAENTTTEYVDAFTLSSASVTFEKDPCEMPMKLQKNIANLKVKIGLTNTDQIETPPYTFNISGGSGDFSAEIIGNSDNLAVFRAVSFFVRPDGTVVGDFWDKNGLPTKRDRFYGIRAPDIKATSTPQIINGNAIDGTINITLKDGLKLHMIETEYYIEVPIMVKDNICPQYEETATAVVLFKLADDMSFNTKDTNTYEQFLRVGFNDTGKNNEFIIHLLNDLDENEKDEDRLARWKTKVETDQYGDENNCGYDEDDNCKWNLSKDDMTKRAIFIGEDKTYPVLDIRKINKLEMEVYCDDGWGGDLDYSLWEYGIKVGDWCGKITEKIKGRECQGDGRWESSYRDIKWYKDKDNEFCKEIPDNE